MSRRRSKIPGQWTWQLVEMKQSPAWRVLSQSGHRIIDRLEIELAQHGGKDNGRLPVTYEHFVEYGVERHSVGPAIREVVALGFVEITQAGRGGNAEYRKPNLFRLTYRPTEESRQAPTDEWKRIATMQDAQAAKRLARLSKTESRCGNSPPKPMGETPTETPKFPMGETLTTGRGKTPTTSISRGGAPSSPKGRERASRRASRAKRAAHAEALATFERKLTAGAIPAHQIGTWRDWLRTVVDATKADDPAHGRAEALLHHEAFAA